MARSYEDITDDRRSKLGDRGSAQSASFERAYEIAMQVIALREQHGLTQTELAERCGVDQADISRIERGATSPTARTLQRIADSLDADLKLVARSS
jgi:XRE family transcriptional regulator, regulator of sulfur utilization